MLLKRYILTDNLAFRVWIVPMSKQVVVIKLQIITVLPYLYISTANKAVPFAKYFILPGQCDRKQGCV